MTSAPTLRPYQLEALQAIRAHLARGERRLLVALPTGCGKTVCFAALPGFLGLPGRWLVLAHREELLDQALRKFRAANPGLTCEVEQADRRAGAADVVIASVATLQRARLEALDPEGFAGVIVDEAHHATAESYRRVLERFGLLEPDCPRPLLGFTATPTRGDGVGLDQVFQSIAYSMTLREAIEAGWLCGLAGLRISAGADLTRVATRAGDFAQGQLADAVNTPERNALVARAYLEHAPGRRALAFGVTVAHAEELAAALLAEGVPAACVTGETPREERRATLERFAAGELQVVSNCGVLTEGFDDPGVACILQARPTQSGLLYAQIIGRGTRPAPGKADCLVIDFVDNCRRHKLNTVASLFGLPPEHDCRGRDVLKARADFDEELRQRFARPAPASPLAATASRIDLLAAGVPPEIDALTSFRWLGVPDGYRLLLPEREAMRVSRDLLGRWRVALADAAGHEQTVGEFSTLAEAVQRADAMVRSLRRNATALLNRRAGWRGGLATDKQIAALKRWRVPTWEGMTKGEASDLMDAAIARRGQRGHQRRAGG